MEPFEIRQFSYLPFQLQIEQRHFSSELKDFINRSPDDYVVASEVLSIVQDLLIREHPFDLSGAVDNIMNYSSNDGFRLLLSAIKGGDRKVITQFLNNPTYANISTVTKVI